MRAFLVLPIALLIAASFWASSCGGDEQQEILVFAAASLTNIMDDLGRQFTEAQGIKVRFNLGGSTSLAQQIIRGAPADAFIFAGIRPIAMLEDRGHIVPGTRVDLLTNQLVMVAHSSTAEGLGIASVEELVGTDVRVAIADPDLAPAGQYTREALQSLGLWQQLEPRLVFSPNVRVALGYVEGRNADVGILYRTDAKLSEDLHILGAIPSESHSPIIYPGGVLERSDNREAAGKFLAFLSSREARETYLEYGFIPYEG